MRLCYLIIYLVGVRNRLRNAYVEGSSSLNSTATIQVLSGPNPENIKDFTSAIDETKVSIDLTTAKVIPLNGKVEEP